MTPTQCTRQQLLKWEQEAQQMLAQNPMPFVMKLLKTDLKTMKWLRDNAIMIQASKDAINRVEKKYYQCDLEGVIKMEIVKENNQYIPKPILVEGAKIEEFQKDMQACYNAETQCNFE